MTTDLLCLVADRNMQSAVSALLARPKSLGIRPITFRIHRHPEQDSGCFHQGAQYLANLREGEEHGIIVLDFEWDGPAATGLELESMLEDDLQQIGLGDWGTAVVIEPELEAWVFSGSIHVPKHLGWTGGSREFRRALQRQGLWPNGDIKPPDPKRAMEWALAQARIARSSVIYEDLASSVGTKNCADPAFQKFRKTLRSWFP